MSWLDSVSRWLTRRAWRADVAALLTLTLLWAFYFWRVLTPNPLNQVSLPEGDFSGQFVAFGAYQARRLLAGELPLWNPYNYAGHPFIADTQAAVLYPVRLLTILISHLTGGWSYAALQFETIAHYWLGSTLMYLFVRTIAHSRMAGLVSAMIVTYGGYLTGYPPLQLAVLEAGIWLPLCLLGVYKATEDPGEGLFARRQVRWLALSAAGLGISLLAGHPQTGLFISYTLLAYLLYRAIRQRLPWQSILLAALLVFGLGYGLAAIQLLPGLEYTRHTIRAGYGYEALAGGFPFSDLITILLPNVLTVWSPLYSGIAALALAGFALWANEGSARFWGVVVAVALALSFGGATIFYRLAYLVAPGFSWFRGQERAAYLIAYGLAILAGLGTAALQHRQVRPRQWQRILGVFAALGWLAALEIFIVDRVIPEAGLFDLLKAAFFLGILATLCWLLIGRLGHHASQAWWPVALLTLVVFDVFSNTIDTNWEPIPVSERSLIGELATTMADDPALFRIDAQFGLSSRGPGENYGTMIGLQDIRGTSPLRLASLDHYYSLPQYRLHQLLSVKYVLTDWQELEVPSMIQGEATIGGSTTYLHEIETPLPRAWMVYRVMTTGDDGQALGWLADPSFDPGVTAILETQPDLNMPDEPPTGWQVSVTSYEPERITLAVDTPRDGVLVLSELDYPGWRAAVDGENVPIWRADAGLRALPLRAGSYQIAFSYRPLSVLIGEILSAVCALALLLIEIGPALLSRGGGRPAAEGVK
jgi:hypothetical protein